MKIFIATLFLISAVLAHAGSPVFPDCGLYQVEGTVHCKSKSDSCLLDLYAGTQSSVSVTVSTENGTRAHDKLWIKGRLLINRTAKDLTGRFLELTARTNVQERPPVLIKTEACAP